MSRSTVLYCTGFRSDPCACLLLVASTAHVLSCWFSGQVTNPASHGCDYVELPLTSHGVTPVFSGYGHDFSGNEWAATSGVVLCVLALLARARTSHPNRQNRSGNRNRCGLLEAT